MDFIEMLKRDEVKRYLIPVVFVTALVIGVFNLDLDKTSFTNSGTSSGQMIGYNSVVCKTIERADGSIENLGCNKNTFVNNGKNITRDLLGTGTGSAVNVIGLGNGTGDGGATASNLGGLISDCGLNPAYGTYSTIQASAGNWTIAKTFTSACSNEVVNSTALYNSVSAGSANYFAANSFASPITLQNGDQLMITWNIWVQ